MELTKEDISHLVELIKFDDVNNEDEIFSLAKQEVHTVLWDKLLKIASQMLRGEVKPKYKVKFTELQKATIRKLCNDYNHPFHYVLIAELDKK